MAVLWVGLGGALGAIARYLIAGALLARASQDFPVGTLAVNLTGSLLIGVIMTTLAERAIEDPAWRLFLVVGFLGGYTTFSSFSYEALSLIQRGAVDRALLYVVGSNLLGIAATWIGVLLVLGRR